MTGTARSAEEPATTVTPVIAEQVRLLHAGLPTAVAGNLLVAAITAWVLWDVVPSDRVFVWFTVFAAVMAARMSPYFTGRHDAGADTGRQRGILRAGALGTGLAWGIVPVVLFPAGDLAHQAFLPFIAAGITGAAVAALAADRVSVLLLIIPALVPLILRMFMEGGEIPDAMGMMALLYLVYLVAAARRGERAFLDTVQLRDQAVRQNEALRASEAKLRETGQLLDSVVENIPNMIFMKRASDLRFVLFNRAGEELLGYARQDLLGKNDYDLFPREQADFFTGKDREVLDHGFEDIAEEPIQTRARGERILHTKKIALRDEHGAPQYLLGISDDITEQKRAEAALRDSAARIRAIVDNVVDAIITIDEHGVIESFNPAAEHIFGYSASEVLGRRLSMLMPEPHQSMHDDYLDRHLATGESRMIGAGREVEGRRKGGALFPMELAVSEVLLGDKRIYTGVVRDITERKKIERLKSEFISTVSHELRTPLTSIRGSLALLAGGATGKLPDPAHELVQIADKNAERLARLINDILDIEKITSGRMSFSMRPQPLMPLVEQALAANRGYAAQYGVTFRLADTIGAGVVNVDAERFLQVMANLLSNAAKFSPRGEAVDIAVAKSDGGFRVSVTDRGPGVPEAFRPHVFEKFSQADASDSRAKGGSGLGLAISREIMENMSGRIGYDSSASPGATFWVELRDWQQSADPRPSRAARRNG